MNYGKKYDIFISYRRVTGRDDARLLQLALAARGYSVFFDYDSLKDGRFNEAIYSAIDACDVFILMMTQGSLDRCVEEGDWVRLEIARALEKGKHIVPVAPSDQTWDWPENLPSELSAVKNEQVSQLDKEALFDRSIDEIEENRFSAELKDRRRAPGVMSDGDTYLSSVSHASEVFVGRDRELAKLSRMLSEHKIPVITGAGGTGKSELVRQYAVRYRDAYPGGRFQVDMETARTWNDVFEKLLAGRLGNGQTVRDLLDDREMRERDPRPLDVPQALLRRARRSGPVLLFLDNVDSLSPFTNKDGRLTLFQTDLADGVFIDIVITARICDVMMRVTGNLESLALGDLMPEAARELVLKDFPDADEIERAAAGRVAAQLGYRALYLRRLPTLLADDYAPVICSSFVELEKELQKNLFATIATETEETHLPEVLWKMTCDRLSQIKLLGSACIKLAQVASFFSPDGFAPHILKYLWKTVVAPDLEERLFDRAVKITQGFNVFQSVSPICIHRLDREAILESAKAQSKIEEVLGAVLSTYQSLSIDDWVVLYEHDALRKYLPKPLAESGIFWQKLLCEKPQLENLCPWEKLSGSEWSNLLRLQPCFANHCSWDKLNEEDWNNLLCFQPQFANRCAPEKMDSGYLNFGNRLLVISRLLGSAPSDIFTSSEWAHISGHEWVSIVRVMPYLADYCPWDNLGASDWADVLKTQPQFAKYCSWAKLNKYGHSWSSLLCCQPQFASRCQWWSLNGDDWGELLRAQPQFAEHCSWEKLDGDNWCKLLCAQPQFAKHCPWEKIDVVAWIELLRVQPQFADHCPWEKLSTYEPRDFSGFYGRPYYGCFMVTSKGGSVECFYNIWSHLLSMQPQFETRCPWEKLDGRAWSELLRMQPQFATRCPWEKLDGRAWSKLLECQPQFASHCQWERLNGEDWAELLCTQPMFAGHCPWKKLYGIAWSTLLRIQPQFEEHCSWGDLFGADWSALLRVPPQFARHCPWKKLSKYDWRDLLRNQPQFAKHCPFQYIKRRRWCSLAQQRSWLVAWMRGNA